MSEQVMIEVENLTRKFGGFVAVDHVSFAVPKGRVFGFLGPNGAGKSTTIRMLTTLLRPTAGTARISGYDLVKEPDKVRRKIGLVSEKLIVYDRLTARENLRLFGRLNHLPDDIIRERTEHWLRALKMEPWADHLAGTFSTGMKQRVNIARALLNMPEVLFLDEPTLGLDPQTTRSIREFIQDLRSQGVTIVLTTHQMYEAEALCDTIGIIDRGRMVAVGTSSELKKMLNGDGTAVIDLEIPNLSDDMVTAIAEVPSVKHIGHETATRLRVQTVAGTAGGASGAGGADPGAPGDTIGQVLARLLSSGARLASVNMAEPTLEDVFVQLTGHEMRDEVQDKVPSGRGHSRQRVAQRVAR